MSLADLYAGDAHEVAALAEQDVDTWQQLLEDLYQQRAETAAPPAFVAALLAHDGEVEAWFDRAAEAARGIDSQVFFSSLAALRVFRGWLLRGLRGALPPGDKRLLTAEYELLLNSVPDDALAQVQALEQRTRAAGVDALFHADVLLLLHRRRFEAGEYEASLAPVLDAEQRFAAANASERRDVARRRRAGSLLCLQRYDEAFELFEPLLEADFTDAGPGGAVSFGGREQTPLEEALEDLAVIGTWASYLAPEWSRSLGGLAEVTQAPEHWARFERALRRMFADSVAAASDAEVVVEQALEREHAEVARRTRAIAGELAVSNKF